MRTLIFVGLALATFGSASTAAKEETVRGVVKELKASPYAKEGGLGQILLQEKDKELIVFHVMKTTKIGKLVDGKVQPAKYEDIKAGAEITAVYDGEVLKSDPPQATATELVIVSPAK